jgi:hypothetical protein
MSSDPFPKEVTIKIKYEDNTFIEKILEYAHFSMDLEDPIIKDMVEKCFNKIALQPEEEPEVIVTVKMVIK